MADGRHVGKYSKCHNSLTNGPTGTQLGWSHPIVFSTCPPCCCCHGNGRSLATAHWTFCSYGRLEAECANQFWWNLVRNSNLGLQWLSRDEILKFKMADGRHVGKYSTCHNSPNNGPTVLWRNLDGHIPSCSRHVRHVAVAVATAYQRRIEHSAAMGVWRPNAWTNFVEIWYATAN